MLVDGDFWFLSKFAVNFHSKIGLLVGSSGLNEGTSVCSQLRYMSPIEYTTSSYRSLP